MTIDCNDANLTPNLIRLFQLSRYIYRYTNTCSNILACKCLLILSGCKRGGGWNSITAFWFLTIIWAQITVLRPFLIFLVSGFSGLRRSVFYIVQILHWGTRGITEVRGPACSWAVSPEPLLPPDRSSVKAWRRVLSQHLENTSSPAPQVLCVSVCSRICCKFWFNWILYKGLVWPWIHPKTRLVSVYIPQCHYSKILHEI